MRLASRRKSLSGRESRHPELAKDLAWNRCFAALNMTVTYVRKPKRKRASLSSERNRARHSDLDTRAACRSHPSQSIAWFFASFDKFTNRSCAKYGFSSGRSNNSTASFGSP